jgi:hypothetical protein
MVDVPKTIWENKTLGAAANGQFLDVVVAQQDEIRNARIEKRPPRTAIRQENGEVAFVNTPPSEPVRPERTSPGRTLGSLLRPGAPGVKSLPQVAIKTLTGSPSPLPEPLTPTVDTPPDAP